MFHIPMRYISHVNLGNRPKRGHILKKQNKQKKKLDRTHFVSVTSNMGQTDFFPFRQNKLVTARHLRHFVSVQRWLLTNASIPWRAVTQNSGSRVCLLKVFALLGS